MRQTTVIVLVVTLAFAGIDTARAAQEDDAPGFRNPIEWLLSDIGKLLSNAVSKKPQTPTEQAKQADPVPEPKPDAEPVSEPAPIGSATKDDTQATAAEEKSSGFRNPISWLFSDLARIFQPDLEIEKSPQLTSDPTAPGPTPETKAVEAAAPATPEIAAEAAVETEPAEVRDSDKQPKNPISWLFRDLARLLSPDSKTSDATVADAPAPANPEPETAITTAAVSADTVAAAAAAMEAPTAKNESPAPIAQHAIADVEIEVGPWVPRPADDPFDPSNSLFTTDARPLLPVPASVTPSAPAPAVETADVSEHSAPGTTSEIRERPPYRPLRRNHAALGHEHKAVAPDRQDLSIVDRVLESLFGIDEPVEAEETLANKISDRIVPEEKLDLGYTAPDAPIPDQELTRLENGPLATIDLYMGKDSVIGAPYDNNTFKKEACIERALHGSVFCLKALNWPAEIASSFNADTAFVLPGEGVVRFENGNVSRVYSVFNASDFTKIVKYMQHHFGPPQEREVGWMHMLEAPQMPNTTFRWKAVSADRRDTIILEVRNFDDLRRSFADMEHGMVRLYRLGSRPIFKHISTMDLMLMQRRRVANAPVDINTPPKQQ